MPLAAWTGSEWIVWGTDSRLDGRPLDGAAYDPVADSWRPIADGPIEVTDATAMWTGSEFVVVGAALHGGNFPETETAIAAAYNPVSDTWRTLADSPINPNSNTATWTGDRVVAVDYSHVTASLDPASGDWTELGTLPGQQCEGGLDAARSVEGWVLVEDCGTVSLLPPGSDEWVVAEGTPQVASGEAIAAEERDPREEHPVRR